MGKFDDLVAAVASFGDTNKVIFDDVEMPSIMVGVPKMKYSDLITGGTDDVLDVFKVDGVERDVLYISKYLNIVVNGRAYSLPMKDPKTKISFDQAVVACRNKGIGWGLTPNGLWSAIMLWCNRNKFLPRGNTNNGGSHENAYQHERGICSQESGDDTIKKVLTGSGPIAWYHDGTEAGVADLCGNVDEWVNGLRIVNCEIQIIPEGNCMKYNCDMSENSPEWKAILPDGQLVTPGTEGTLHYGVGSNNRLAIRSGPPEETETWDGTPFGLINAANGLTIPQIIKANGLMKDTSHIFSTTGHMNTIAGFGNSSDECMPERGSYCGSNTDGGIAMLRLVESRSNGLEHIGFRCAYDEMLAAGD